MKVYTAVQITPHHAGFGMYQVGELQVSSINSYECFDDLIYYMCENSFACENIEDALSLDEFIRKGIVDVRGHVYNEPNDIYAVIDDYGALSYFGVVESNVSEDFYNS
jgi:hypothetical protein